MKAIEKLNLSKELRGVLSGIDALKGIGKLNAAKRVREIVKLLTGDSADVAPTTDQADNQPNPFYQSILDGAPLTRDLLTQAIAEVEKDPTHWQVKAAYDSLVQQVEALENAA